MDDDNIEGTESFSAMLSLLDTSTGVTLPISLQAASITITDHTGKYYNTSCPASQLVRNTSNIGI